MRARFICFRHGTSGELCEHGEGPWISVKSGIFFDYSSDCSFLKYDSTPSQGISWSVYHSQVVTITRCIYENIWAALLKDSGFLGYYFARTRKRLTAVRRFVTHDPAHRDEGITIIRSIFTGRDVVTYPMTRISRRTNVRTWNLATYLFIICYPQFCVSFLILSAQCPPVGCSKPSSCSHKRQIQTELICSVHYV